MNILQTIFFSVLMVLWILFCIYWSLRISIPILADKGNFFISPKIGRIVARVRAGKVVEYFANFRGLKRRINSYTGEVISAPEIEPSGFWWNLFGAHWIGFDSVHTYKLEILEPDQSGKLKPAEKDARSIFLNGTYTVIMERQETQDGLSTVSLVVRVNTETVHAGRSFKYEPNWLKLVLDSVHSTMRSYIATLTMEAVVKLNTEGDVSTALKDRIIALNEGGSEDTGLIHMAGQKILSIALVCVDIDDKGMAAAKQAEEIAERNGAAAIKTAEKTAKAVVVAAEGQAKATIITAEAAKKAMFLEAEGQQALGKAVNAVLTERAGAIGPDQAAKTFKYQQVAASKLTTYVEGGGAIVTTPAAKAGQP